MKVHLTIDVEVWCGGWDRLDERFEASFERCIVGGSPAGDYALPKTLEILRRHGLRAVFFVEVLFSARFGAAYLRRIVDLIRADGHEVQLHIHPEWIDELDIAVIPDRHAKRQHLAYYDLDEQTAIIAFGKRLLQDAGIDEVLAFRAGSYAANRDTLEALRRNGIFIDSSFNPCFAVSGPDLRGTHALRRPFVESDVTSFPITTFHDGLGRLRPAQVGACSFEELRDTLLRGVAARLSHFVIVSQGVELMHPNSTEPDRLVVARFERLCAFLARRPTVFEVCGYRLDTEPALPFTSQPALRSSTSATLRRHVEQGRRAVAHRRSRRRVRPNRLPALQPTATLAPVHRRTAEPAAPGDAPLAMRAVLIASRESPEVLAAAVRGLLAALRGRSVVDVLVNGNPDLARQAAAVDWPIPAADVQVRVWHIALGDKANAWNRYVHDVWTEAECTFFVDGYVRVRPDALVALVAAARAAPEALVASGVPSVGRSAQTLRRQMLSEGGVHGNLFMLPAVTMRALRSRGFRLPIGIYRTESTLGAALCFGMEPARHAWNPGLYIAVCPEASWDIDEKRLWSFERVRSQWKRMGRQAQGVLENAAVRALLAGRQRAPERLPSTVQQLIRGWLETDPAEVRRTLHHAPLRRAALRRLQAGSEWPEAALAATLLRASD